ncbi:MAG: hypothetical protein R6U32_02635 [Candidatus Woesearchaeota archaeon]
MKTGEGGEHQQLKEYNIGYLPSITSIPATCIAFFGDGNRRTRRHKRKTKRKTKRREEYTKTKEGSIMYIMNQNATKEQINELCSAIRDKGLKVTVVDGESQSTIHPIGDEAGLDLESLAGMDGVQKFISVQGGLRIVKRANHPEYNTTKVKPVRIGKDYPVTIGGNGGLTVIAGPCAVQTYEQTLEVAEAVKASGAHILRGGTRKPRSSPHSDQGNLEERTEILVEVGRKVGMPVMTEVLDPRDMDYLAGRVDAVWTGARNAGNMELYKEAGRQSDIPVLIKNNFKGAVVDEWLSAAEYVAGEGNTNIGLIYRGEAIPPAKGNREGIFDSKKLVEVQRESYLPMIVDPSHASGRNWYVEHLVNSSVGLPGVSALMIEVIPENAGDADIKSDYQHAVRPSQFGPMIEKARKLYSIAHDNTHKE